MLTCKQLDEFLVDYLDGNLGLRQRLSMQMHLGLCRECREFLDEYKRAIEIGREVCTREEDLEQVPEALIQAVLANIGAHDDGSSPRGDR